MSMRRVPRRARPQILVVANPTESSDESDDARPPPPPPSRPPAYPGPPPPLPRTPQPAQQPPLPSLLSVSPSASQPQPQPVHQANGRPAVSVNTQGQRLPQQQERQVSPQLPRSYPVYDIHANYPPTSGESSTSRSSPAPESTPPPTTPGTLLPSENAIPRAEPALKTAVDDLRISTLNGQQPLHFRRPSDSQLAVPRSPVAVAGPSSPKLHPHITDRLIIMASVSEAFAHVDITGARSSDFIRERIFSKLQIADDDQHKYQIFQTEAGDGPCGPPLSGNELLSLCLQQGDRSGSLKFLILLNPGYRQQLHVDTQVMSSPPVPIPAPQGDGGAGFSPLIQKKRAAQQQQHAKAHSISSGGNDVVPVERDYHPESDVDDRRSGAPAATAAWRPYGKAPRSGSPQPSSARDVTSPNQSSPRRYGRPTSPSPVSSNGTTMLSASTPRQGGLSPPSHVAPDPSSWRPQPQYGSFADAGSPRAPPLRAYMSKSGQKVIPSVPPPPSRAPPPVPTNVSPFAGRPVYKALPTPSSSSPYSARSPQYSSSQSARPSTGGKGIDPRWLMSVPGQSPSTAQRLPLGLPPPPPPPPQSPTHRLPPARSVGDLRGASHGGRVRPSTGGEKESPTTTSPFSPRHEGLPFAPMSADHRAQGFGQSRTPDPYRQQQHGPPSHRIEAWSDTEGGTMMRRPPLPFTGQMSPVPRHAERSRDPARGLQSPTRSPRGLQSPRLTGETEATLMPTEYGHLLPLLSHNPNGAASAPNPSTPSPSTGITLVDDTNTKQTIEMTISSSYGDDEDTLWAKKPEPQQPRPIITVSVNGLEGAPLSAKSANTPSPSPLSPSKTYQPKRRPQSTFGAREGLTWNVRPPPEDVYEHLEEFFPEHDLDKPLIELPSGGSSPIGPESPAAPAPPPPPLQMSQPPQQAPAVSSRSKHKKSIRVVANERRRIIDRSSKMEPTAAADLLRKRSTKLWDIKVEEVTPSVGKGGAPLSAGPDSPTHRGVTKWVKGDLIGKGTYGKVYLALNINTGEMIAVKQVELPKTDSDRNDTRQTTVVEAIKSESATLRELEHPHVVQYLGFEETSDYFNLFLEYVPGGSIGGVLRKLGKFSEDVSKSFTSQILSGLEYLHSRQVLHRDLKGDNILVDASGVCKISDFGISKRTTDIYGLDASATNMQGSIFWMAPEVLSNGGQGYSAKIDIWSVGCIYVEMITGHRPWRDEDFVSVMYKLGASKERPPIPELSTIASEFASLCFAPDPDDRPIAADLRKHRYLDLPADWKFTGFT